MTAPTIVLSANSDWNIANFRQGLIRGLRSAGYEPVVIAPQDPAMDARMQQLDVERIPIRVERAGLNPLADLKLLLVYRQLLGRIRPRAYLGFTIKPNIYGSLASASLGIPAIPNVSGIGNAFIRRDPVQRTVTTLSRFGFRRAPVVFFQNEEDRQLFLGRKIVRPDQARLLPGSGVDLEHFAPVPPAGDEATFLLIARLVRDKGVVEFVDAARSLRAHLPGARFQLLGGTDEGHRTSIPGETINNWVKEGVIDYLGTTDDVRPYIAAATAIVLPSYREGLPRSLLEAGAMARPLIATDVPGCRDVIEDGVNGYLCGARDSASLAAAMRRMAELPAARRHAIGEAARRKVQERFSEAFVVRAYLDVLAGLDPAKPGS
jgi:glycosyltransferase involved in cell wall biosynthesis